MNLVSRDIQSTVCHATSTFANKCPNCGTWTAVQLFSFHSLVNRMPHSWHRAKACCVMWLRGDAGQDRVFWCDLHPHVMGNVTLTRISSQLPACQVVARTVKGCWTALSESKRCHVVSDDFVSRLNVRRSLSILVVSLHRDGRQTSHVFTVCVPDRPTY